MRAMCQSDFCFFLIFSFSSVTPEVARVISSPYALYDCEDSDDDDGNEDGEEEEGAQLKKEEGKRRGTTEGGPIPMDTKKTEEGSGVGGTAMDTREDDAPVVVINDNVLCAHGFVLRAELKTKRVKLVDTEGRDILKKYFVSL